jgi:mannose-6-phosphate isomerase-like protein (cupin superfamily)
MSRASKPSRINKPWGYEDIFAKTDKYVGKLIFIKKGARLSRQHHEVKDETIFVLQGNLLVEFGMKGEITSEVVPSGNAVRIPAKTVHRFIALDGDTLLVEVSTPELDDVVRHEDDYGRQGTSNP